MAGYQAAALSGRPSPKGSRALLDWLARVIGPIEEDRPFGEDLERLTEASFDPPELSPPELSPPELDLPNPA
jgi:hypothetical protein